MKEIVNKLSADCDAYVARVATQRSFPLYLMGGETPFLKAIAKKHTSDSAIFTGRKIRSMKLKKLIEKQSNY